MSKYILDVKINNYRSACGGYKSEQIRSIYLTDYVIKNGEIQVIKTDFTEKEFEEQKTVLIQKAKQAFNKLHTNQIDEVIGVRKIE